MYYSSKHIVDFEILRKRFSCDLNACKGACCTFEGGSGAPVNADEIANIKAVFPVVKKYLPVQHIETVERKGLFEQEGAEVFLQCVDRRACVFVMYEGAIAKCAIQHAHARGEVGWMKPRSCSLFPIRVHDGSPARLSFEFFQECHEAIIKGEKENISLVSFLEQPLRREFGDSLFEQLELPQTDSTIRIEA